MIEKNRIVHEIEAYYRRGNLCWQHLVDHTVIKKIDKLLQKLPAQLSEIDEFQLADYFIKCLAKEQEEIMRTFNDTKNNTYSYQDRFYSLDNTWETFSSIFQLDSGSKNTAHLLYYISLNSCFSHLFTQQNLKIFKKYADNEAFYTMLNCLWEPKLSQETLDFLCNPQQAFLLSQEGIRILWEPLADYGIILNESVKDTIQKLCSQEDPIKKIDRYIDQLIFPQKKGANDSASLLKSFPLKKYHDFLMFSKSDPLILMEGPEKEGVCQRLCC